MTPLLQAHHAMEKMEEFVHKVMSSNQTGPGTPLQRQIPPLFHRAQCTFPRTSYSICHLLLFTGEEVGRTARRTLPVLFEGCFPRSSARCGRGGGGSYPTTCCPTG